MTSEERAGAPGEGAVGTPSGALSTEERVLAALDAVIDPELDEPITTLRFVSSVAASPDGDVDVALRLPTPQCAPNFAFLMAADARDAVRRLPGVRRVTVTLEDHYTGDEINGALARGQGFTGAFPGETADDDLTGLRELFSRKALTARQANLCRSLLSTGATAEQVVAMTVAELPDGPEARRCVALRAQLGIDARPRAPAFVLPDGEPLSAAALPRWLRMASLIATSLETNGGICRDLLAVRHGLEQGHRRSDRA
ncbi:MAG: iron-sulfur cluster assembly protein [Solirubrobacterales bacterium]|nr:iron-sulfur cluster assembly protein [Solirubrobacterales bacterium]